MSQTHSNPFSLACVYCARATSSVLERFLHNFKDGDAWLQQNSLDCVPCPCHKFLHMLPEVCITHGHVVTGIEHLGTLHQSFGKQGACRAVPSRSAKFQTNCNFYLWCQHNHQPLAVFPTQAPKRLPRAAGCVCVCGPLVCKGCMHMCRGVRVLLAT